MSSGEFPVAVRPWASLWITIHFFSICVCLSANLAPSELQRRIMKMLAPYTLTTHQDYGAVPLEMTRGDSLALDWKHVFELHDAETDIWHRLDQPSQFFSRADRRWASFNRMLAIAAIDKSDPLVHLLMTRAIDVHRHQNGRKADEVRLVQQKVFDYASDLALSRGELPETDRQDKVLYHCRVVELADGRIRLMPLYESTRTTKSLVGPRALPESEHRP